MRIEQKLCIPIGVITVGNFVNGIVRTKPSIYYFSHVGIFLLLIPIFLFFPKKISDKTLSISLLILSCIGVWFGDYTDLVSITLFCFSLYISSQKKKSFYIYIGIISTFIIIKFTFLGLNVSQMAVFLAGSSFIFIFYHHYIHPSKYKSKDSDIIQKVYNSSKVKSDVVDILQMRVRGFDWPDINDKLELNVTDQHLPRKVRDERKRLGFDTQDQFMFWLFGNGIITPEKTEAEEAAEKRDNL